MRIFVIFQLVVILCLSVYIQNALAQETDEKNNISILIDPTIGDKGDFVKVVGDGVLFGVKIEELQDDLVKVSTRGIFSTADFEITFEERRSFTKGSPKYLFVLDYPFLYDNIYTTTVTNGVHSKTIKWIPLSSTGKPILVEDKIVNPNSMVPPWIKNNAKWWATDLIGESDFVLAIQYLISNKIITVEQATKESHIEINKNQFVPSRYNPDEIVLTGWACHDDGDDGREDVCYQQHVMCKMMIPEEVYPKKFEILRSYDYGAFESKMSVDDSWVLGHYEITCKHLGKSLETLEFDVVSELSADVSDSQKIPPWLKNSAGWWADGTITDIEFLKSIEYLVNNDIVKVQGHFELID